MTSTPRSRGRDRAVRRASFIESLEIDFTSAPPPIPGRTSTWRGADSSMASSTIRIIKTSSMPAPTLADSLKPSTTELPGPNCSISSATTLQAPETGRNSSNSASSASPSTLKTPITSTPMVGEYSGTNGDVLYSNNAGATWSTTPLSFYVGGNEDGRGAGERIAVDPYDSNIIFLGSNANGLWESTNAGHSFSQVTSFSTTASINFVLFDPNGGTAGNPTQEIFVGENSTASGTNLFETTNGGTSWTEVTGTGSAPTGWMPESRRHGFRWQSLPGLRQRPVSHRADQWRSIPLQHLHRRLGQHFARRAAKAISTLRLFRLLRVGPGSQQPHHARRHQP